MPARKRWRFSAAAVGEWAKIALALGLIAGIGYVGYQILTVPDEPAGLVSIARMEELARARERERAAAREAQYAVAKRAGELKLQDRVQRDADAQVLQERTAAEWKKKAAEVVHRREVAFAEFQVDKALRAARERESQQRLQQIEQRRIDRLRADASEPAAVQSEAPRLVMVEMKKQLAGLQAQRVDLERKMAAFMTRYNTHQDAVDRVLQKHGGTPKLSSERVVGNTRVVQPYADALADWALMHANEHEADLDYEELHRVEMEYDANSRVGMALEAKLEALLNTLPDEPAEPVAVRPPAGLKTLYKKDGTEILASSVIYVGDAIEYKDVNGFSGRVKKADVLRVGRDEE